MITLQGVSFRYPGQTEWILHRIDLTVKPGEFLAILGKNGSGKSTLVKLMDGLLNPIEGKVLVDGMEPSEPAQLRMIRQRVGMLFSNPDNQLVSSVVEEDVAFGPENLGLPPKEIEKRVYDALAAVRMEDYRKVPPHLLSGGQKQRVAIAGVLALKPGYLVLDEPTSMLDPAGRREVLETLIRLNREEGAAIILVTHFPEEALLAEKMLVLDRGRIVMYDAPRTVFSQVEDLEALGLEAPEMVRLSAELRKIGVEVEYETDADALYQAVRKAGHKT